ncbi:HEAT repeat domain-containing protein [Pedosphaera parvula]|uniref:PBS lyase HEAT domain protein repeat-containing protein n=1 Tax=Pedosphaera parvula (strain Ellin514) TaxID=320771 RepID=B9XS70_PEDPL|nr:HEAT repeat domain-containing protein [Pedosphaera parvula]EEF57325.1 PBS lyase HEAT domain protein repeat-containing protein [Pedosphaera parvula Ellin514]
MNFPHPTSNPSSRTRTKVVIVSLVLICVVGLTWLVWPTPEPSYNGKPLSFWLEQARTSTRAGELRPVFPSMQTNGEYAEIVQAFHSMGSNAVPVLVANAKDSDLKILCQRLLDKQSFIKFQFTSTFEHNATAIHALSLVGTSALPALEKMLSEKQPTATAATCALGNMGSPEAFQPLCRALTNQHAIVRNLAATSLRSFNPVSPDMIATMNEMLKSPDAVARENAAFVLGLWGYSARSSVPQLLQMTKDKELPVRESATNALKLIDSASAARAGVK